MTTIQRLAFVLSLLLVACASHDDDRADLEHTAAGDCDGRILRYVCATTPGTSRMQYGIAPSCTAAPWLPEPAPSSAITYRESGQDGCEDLPLSLTGTKAARCCP